jgi:hypothetical protein
MALVTSAAASLKNTWGFSPQSIPGLQLWLDAADTTSITGTSPVTAWRDKSGNGYHMNTLQPNGAYTSVYPTVGTAINGLNTVFFSAYAGLTQGVTLSGVKNFYWVGRLSTAGTTTASCYNMLGHNTNYDWHGGNRGTGLYLNATFAEAGIRNATPVSMYGAGVTVTNTTFISLALPGGGSIHMVSAAGITDNTYTRYQGICYDRDNQQTGWVGDVGEAIVFSQALTTAQHQQVEGYLAAKWGLKANLPATHPYYASASIPFNRPFYPTDIGGCALWLDGADVGSMVLSGTTVTQWNDKSGNGGNAAAVNTPTLSATGTGVTLNGTNSCFVANTVTVPKSSHCLIAVHTPTTVTAINPGNTSLFRFEQGGGYIVFPYMQTANLAKRGYISSFVSGTNTIDYNNSTLLENSSAGIPNLIVANISSSTQFAYKNGNQQSSTTATMTSGTSDFLAIGASRIVSSSSFGEPYSGTISEILIYSNALTTPQRQQVEQYLTWKWGLPTANLPTCHPGKLLPAFSTNFTPKSVAGMTWWVDGMDTSTMTFSSGSNITEWRDKSGNAYHATGVNSPQKLSSGGVSFNSASSQRFSMSVPYSNTNTMFMVASPVPSTTDSMYYIGQNNPNYCGAMFLGGYNSSYVASFYPANPSVGGSPSQIPVLSTGLPTTPFLVSSVKTAAVSAVGYYNGSGAYSQGDTATAGPTYWDNVGAASQGNNHLTANIYELIFFSVALTNSQRQQVEGYLAWKWGLQRSLPSTHAYAKFAP